MEDCYEDIMKAVKKEGLDKKQGGDFVKRKDRKQLLNKRNAMASPSPGLRTPS